MHSTFFSGAISQIVWCKCINSYKSALQNHESIVIFDSVMYNKGNIGSSLFFLFDLEENGPSAPVKRKWRKQHPKNPKINKPLPWIIRFTSSIGGKISGPMSFWAVIRKPGTAKTALCSGPGRPMPAPSGWWGTSTAGTTKTHRR